MGKTMGDEKIWKRKGKGFSFCRHFLGNQMKDFLAWADFIVWMLWLPLSIRMIFIYLFRQNCKYINSSWQGGAQSIPCTLEWWYIYTDILIVCSEKYRKKNRCYQIWKKKRIIERKREVFFVCHFFQNQTKGDVL